MKRPVTAIIMLLALCGGSRADWPGGGIEICHRCYFDDNPMILYDPGNLLIYYIRERESEYDSDLMVQAVDPNGNMLLETGGSPVCDVDGDQLYPVILRNETGVLIAWPDDRAESGEDVYANSMISGVLPVWGTTGILACAAPDFQWPVSITTDCAGGAVVAIWDHAPGRSDIYAQRIDKNGVPQWLPAGGVPVCTQDDLQSRIITATDMMGGAYIAWKDWRRDILGRKSDIFMQRINGSGAVQWTDHGIPVTHAGYSQEEPRVIPDGEFGTILSFEDSRYGSNVYMQRIGLEGSAQWADYGIPVCPGSSSQEDHELIAAGSGESIVVFSDGRSGDFDIYAQRVDADGNILWGDSAAAIYTGAGDQEIPCIAGDDGSGYVIAWRSTGVSGESVKCMKIDAQGNPLWIGPPTEAGRVEYSEDGVEQVRITGDGEGGAYILWSTVFTAIYLQRVRSNGDIVACLLEGYSAEAVPAGIDVTWRIAGSTGGRAGFIISRSESSGPYRPLNVEVTRAENGFRFTDERCITGKEYSYRVEMQSETRMLLFETEPVIFESSGTLWLRNHPNPFNPSTGIGYFLPEGCRVTIEIFDAAGASVNRLLDEVQRAGRHELVWDGRDGRGDPVGAGVYFVRLSACKRSLSRKLVLIR